MRLGQYYKLEGTDGVARPITGWIIWARQNGYYPNLTQRVLSNRIGRALRNRQRLVAKKILEEPGSLKPQKKEKPKSLHLPSWGYRGV